MKSTESAARAIIFLIAFALFAFFVAGQQAAPDLILYGGKIFTNVASRPYVEALAIRGDRIVATGDSKQIRSLAATSTRQIYLSGHTVIPGINDAHNHVGVLPPNWYECQFQSPDPSSGDVKNALVAAAASQAKGTFLFAQIGPTVFHDTAVDRDWLDKITSTHPVILQTFTGHAMILNSAALAVLGVDENVKDPVGGRFERSAKGRLTGVVREYAVFQLNRKLGSLPDEATAVSQLREFFKQASRWGITSIQDMSDSIAPDRAVALFSKVPTPVRIRIIRMPGTTLAGRNTQEGWPPPRSSDPLIRVSGMKWLLDGVPIEGTLLPRDDKTSIADLVVRLPLTFPEPTMETMLHEAISHNEQLMVHVSGYPAAAAMIQAMEATGGAVAWSGKRLRFEHGDGLLPDLIPATAKLGIVVVQNPTHLDALDLAPTVGESFRPIKAQPLRSLLAAGIPVALGSDGPMNPYLNIMLASVHPDRPDEALTREQAVTAYTLTSAYAEFAEKQKGSLEPGKLADLAVLSQDIFTIPVQNLPKTESVLTLVGGKAVYDAAVLKQ